MGLKWRMPRVDAGAAVSAGTPSVPDGISSGGGTFTSVTRLR